MSDNPAQNLIDELNAHATRLLMPVVVWLNQQLLRTRFGRWLGRSQ